LCVLSGPAILRISVLLIIAGILAALVQSLLPSPAPAPVPAAAPPSVVQPAEPPPPPTDRAAPAAPAQDATVRDAPVRDIPAAPQETTAPSSPAQMPADALAFPSDPAAAPPAQEPVGEAEIDRAEDSAGPRALAVLDLNTASVADLNRLRGGGTIGRAIVAKRPYTSVEQLLSKRVLSRAVYERIKDQVTVR
jgi:DNA uptake protein ComE-like DNA-binding protein